MKMNPVLVQSLIDIAAHLHFVSKVFHCKGDIYQDGNEMVALEACRKVEVFLSECRSQIRELYKDAGT